MGKKRKKIWTATPSCLFWALWRARNRLALENEATTAQRIKINFISNLWTWANLYSNANTNSVLDFSHGWGVGRFLFALFGLFLVVHVLCTPKNFPFYNT